MKANEAPDFPEKVYIPRDPEYPQSPNIWWERESSESNIEYARTDAFIDKAEKYLKSQFIRDVSVLAVGTVNINFSTAIENFVNYMEGE